MEQLNRGKLVGSDMKDFRFTVAFLLPVKAEKTKNFRELLKYAEAMGFHTRFSRCIGGSKILLTAGKVACAPLEVANLLIALHLLATQRKEDVIIVGTIDQVKYQHRLFATLSIEKIRNWSEHLSNRVATDESDAESRSQRIALPPEKRQPRTPPQTPESEEKTPLVVIPEGNQARVLH